MTTLTQTIQTLRTAEAQRYRALTLFPLLQTKEVTAAPAYLTLDEAITRGVARVTEVSSAGSVPELRFQNDGADPVLLLGGEELVGAKQNRTLNLTILVPGKTVMPIPVSCVEAGRWTMRSPEFEVSQRVMPRAMRSKVVADVSQSLREAGHRMSNQQAVWSMIMEQARDFGATSETRAMSATFEKAEISLEEMLRAFRVTEQQVGVAYCLAGKHWGLDLFDHPATLRHYFPKLTRSYGLDALHMEDVPAPADGLATFLARLTAATSHVEAALGLGKDVRLSGSGVTGAGLDWEERFVHLCGFSEAQEKGFESRMQSVRSRFRV